jgi:hypothetical protein
MGLRTVALVVLLALPAGAWAADPAVEVGVELYRHGDFSGAAYALAQALNRGVAEPGDRATAALTLAASEDQLNQTADERKVLTQLFREQPNVRIDPRLYSAGFIRFAESVRHEVTGHGPPQPPPEAVQPPRNEPPQRPPPPAGGPPAFSNAGWRGPHGFELGLRMAYAIPFGDKVRGVRLSDDIYSALPFEFDLGYRMNPWWYFGGWFAGGPTFIRNYCAGGCSSWTSSTGLEVNLHFRPIRYDPWVALGAGYEWLSGTFVSGGFITNSTLHGFMFVRMQTGLDVRFSRGFTAGPYVSYSIGEYGWFSEDGFSGSIPFRAVHSFLDFGVRTTFNFE